MKYSLRHFVPRIVTGLCLASLHCWGNPLGEQVMSGQASFDRSQSGALKITQGSDRSIIHWQKFSIGAGEKTTFIQPNSKSAVLNRVISGDPSSLLGTLNSNGQVFLINPNGILVGAGAQINVGALIASTLDLPDEQFLAGGEMTFSGSSTAGITNLGTIHAESGDVMLFSRTIDNAGSISAPNGTVGLGAGSEILLKPMGEEKVFVKPHAGDGGSVTNRGTISALAAELKASGNPYALAINQTGTIEATGVQERGGRVYLTADGGDITAGGVIRARNANGSGGKIKIAARAKTPTDAPSTVSVTGLVDATGVVGDGGGIDITGDQVGAFAGSRIDASGAANGGTIHFGGGEQGADATVTNARAAYVDQAATLAADGAVNGGRVVVWSDESTRFDGNISAASTADAAGQGGFVEVSGKNFLAFNGTVDTRAVSGQTGSLLLDPQDILITGTTILNNNVSFSSPYQPTGASSTLTYTTLLTALLLSDVTIQTGAAAGPGLGNITFGANALDGFLYPAALTNRTLTLIAAHDININAPITSVSVLGSLSIVLQANTGATNGAVNLNQAITLPFGTLTANGQAVNVSGGLSIEGLTHLVGNSVSLLTTLALNTAADLTIDASQNLTIGAALSNSGTGAITLNGALVNVNAAVSTATGALNVSASLGDITLGAGGSLLTNGGALSLTSVAGDVLVDSLATLNSNGGAISILAHGSAALSDINAGAGNVDVTATLGAITQNAGTITGTQATLHAGLGIGGAINSVATAVNALDFTAGGDVHLLQSGAVVATGSTTANGLIDLRTIGNGTLSVGGAGLSANGSGAIQLLAGNGVVGSSANLSLGGLVQSGTGNITLGAGESGGAIINGIGGTLATGAALTSPLLGAVTSGDLTLSASGNIGTALDRLNVAIGGTLQTSGQSTSAGLYLSILGDATLGTIGATQTIDILALATNAGANGSLTIGNSLTALNGGTISLGADLHIAINAAINAPGSVIISAGLDALQVGALTISAPVSSASGLLSLTASGDIDLGAVASLSTGGAGQIAISSSAAVNLAAGSSVLTTGGEVNIYAGANTTLSSVAAGLGNIFVQSGADISAVLGGSLSGNQITLTAVAGIGTTLNPLETAAVELAFQAGADVSLHNIGSVLAAGQITGNGSIALSVDGGNLTIGAVTTIPVIAGGLNAQGQVQIGLGTTGGGGIGLDVDGNLTINAPTHCGGSGALIVNVSGDASIGAPIGSVSGDISITIGNDLHLTGGGSIIALGGDITISVDAQAGGGLGGGALIIDAGATIDASGTLTLTSDSPLVDLIDAAADISASLVVNIYLDPSAGSGSGSGGSGSGSGGSDFGGNSGRIAGLEAFTAVGGNLDIRALKADALARFSAEWMRQNGNFGDVALQSFIDGRATDSENAQDDLLRSEEGFNLSYGAQAFRGDISRLQSASGFTIVAEHLSSHHVGSRERYYTARARARTDISGVGRLHAVRATDLAENSRQ